VLNAADTSTLPLPPTAERRNHAVVPDLEARIHVEKRGPWMQLGTASGFEWTQVDLPIVSLAEDLNGLRILHLSDFHSRTKWDGAYDELIQKVVQNPPDLILYTGDFVDNKTDHRPGLPVAKKLMHALPSRLGTIGILGNHDGAVVAAGHTGELNVNLIDHRRILVPIGSANLELIGLGGLDRLELDLEFIDTIEEKSPDNLRIVLSHFPDNIRRCQKLRPDLYLCGHSHGGQICFPNRRPILRHDSLPHRLCTGIHRAYGTWMITNRGFGFSSFEFRLFCPAEVIEIRLVKA
jgi:predicted MPP superfamily phosphohydrolase